MKQQVFSSFRDFVKTVSNTYQSISDDEDISIIAKYDEAQEILYELSCLNYRLIFVEFEHPKYSNYNDEYIISIFENQINIVDFSITSGFVFNNFIFLTENELLQIIDLLLNKVKELKK